MNESPAHIERSTYSYTYHLHSRGILILIDQEALEHSLILIQVVVITEVGAYVEAASNVIPFASPPRSVFIRTPS